jgi:hypothetical protein
MGVPSEQFYELIAREARLFENVSHGSLWKIASMHCDDCAAGRIAPMHQKVVASL